MPVPYIADLILRQVVGDRTATDMTYTGRFLDPEEAGLTGLVDGILPDSDLESRVIEKMAYLAGMSNPAYKSIKEHRTENVATLFKRNWARKSERLLACWFDPVVQEKLRQAADKF